MKRAFFCLLLVPAFSFGQSRVPPGTNTIIVHNVTFNDAVSALLKMCYVLQKVDEDNLTVKTEFRRAMAKHIKNRWEISISVEMEGSNAVVRGEHRDLKTKSDASRSQIFDRPFDMNNSLGFAELYQYAFTLGNQITYEKR